MGELISVDGSRFEVNDRRLESEKADLEYDWDVIFFIFDGEELRNSEIIKKLGKSRLLIERYPVRRCSNEVVAKRIRTWERARIECDGFVPKGSYELVRMTREEATEQGVLCQVGVINMSS